MPRKYKTICYILIAIYTFPRYEALRWKNCKYNALYQCFSTFLGWRHTLCQKKNFRHTKNNDNSIFWSFIKLHITKLMFLVVLPSKKWIFNFFVAKSEKMLWENVLTVHLGEAHGTLACRQLDYQINTVFEDSLLSSVKLTYIKRSKSNHICNKNNNFKLIWYQRTQTRNLWKWVKRGIIFCDVLFS